jgi:hypothetical protein
MTVASVVTPFGTRALSKAKSVFQSATYISVMDENGLWRQVPAATLPSVPYAIRMSIQPSVALKILSERNSQNRSIKERRVQKYMLDMVGGNWKVTGSGLQFNRDGILIDGQTRLSAVVRAKQPVEFMVTFGVDDDAVIAIDEGCARSNLDVAKIMGMEGTSKFTMSISSYILEVKGVKEKVSRIAALNFYNSHREALKFVEDRVTDRLFLKAPVGAAIARAYYHCYDDTEQMQMLEKFLVIMQLSPVDYAEQGIRIQPHEIAPVKLRELIEASKDKNTGSARKELYQKTESALWNFLNQTPVVRLHASKEERFPLPEESED